MSTLLAQDATAEPEAAPEPLPLPTADDLRRFRFITLVGRRAHCLTRDEQLARTFARPPDQPRDGRCGLLREYERAPGLQEFDVEFSYPETVALAKAIQDERARARRIAQLEEDQNAITSELEQLRQRELSGSVPAAATL